MTVTMTATGRNSIYVSPHRQYLRRNLVLGGGRRVADLSTRGKRIAQVRRLWAVVLGIDVTQPVAASMIGVSGASWSRWESDEDVPRRSRFEEIAAKSAELGFPEVTAAWLDYAEGSGPPQIGKAPEDGALPVPPTPVVRKRKPAPRTGQTAAPAAKKRRSGGH